ncbi:serine hydroxymethyltransferase [Streptomyces sp. NPDC059477]|uniref:serine hydroxymethyltransferase n=1 Tax=Streptomyces sp. NPDC059477 TaxID=3346847 RepID=UPI0036CA2EE6
MTLSSSPLATYAQLGLRQLHDQDRELYDLLEREHLRQSSTLAMIAASSVAPASVTACEGTVLGNVTTEGYPGARFHAGCEVVDEVERLAIRRAKAAFGARYANVQPHSGSTANQAVMFSLLSPGDVLLGMELSAGGHLTHGSRASVSGTYFTSVGYGTDAAGWIDMDEVERLSKEHRPRLIVCGASAYPREIDFVRFRAIADEVGAFLLADISHISGLVAAGLHPSPVDVAHVTTTSTYKQLYGPRGGLVLMGGDADTPVPGSRKTLAETLQSAVFPYVQGTPQLQAVAAKGRALARVAQPEFRELARRIVSGATVLASALSDAGHHVLTGGTDNHMVLIDIGRRGLTGLVAEQALESCGIIVNKNKIPDDPHGPRVTSGLRLGTNHLAARGMDADAVHECAALVDRVLSSVKATDTRTWHLDEAVRARARAEVSSLCARHPLPDLDATV